VSWFGELTVLCIQVRDVAENVWHCRHRLRLIGADRSGLLVRSVVRFARCNVLLPYFAVRLPDWHNSRAEFMVLSSLLVLARLLAPDWKGTIARWWSVVSATWR
jgi:hypothetical protein